MAKNKAPEIPGLFDDLPEEMPQDQIAKIAFRSWRTHLAGIRSLDKRIEQLIDRAVKQALSQGRKLTAADIGRVFQRHPELRAALDKAMEKLNDDLSSTIEQGSKDAWLRANTASDAIVTAMAANNPRLAALLKASQNKPQNNRALRAFQQREVQGLKLSDRVWRATEGMKLDMERAIEVALAEGVPAQKLSERVRELLKEPHRLYRRVRDKNGNLQLSQAAQKYHPGTGVYRSSYKNAMRVARTEVNMAYQASDSERWTNSWWVKGIRVSLSNNHTCLDSKGKPAPLFDICDLLAGDYPADFKFTGWHPQCRCYATAITCEYADIREYYRRKRAGEDMTGYTPPGAITEPPEQFKQWLADNGDRLAGAASRGTTPYFITNNAKYTDPSWKPSKATPAPLPKPKTPLQIADERHAKRTPEQAEAIQERWTRRAAYQVNEALTKGKLPSVCLSRIQDAEDDIAFGDFGIAMGKLRPLQVAAQRHTSRTIKSVTDIQNAWDARRTILTFNTDYQMLASSKYRGATFKWYMEKARAAYDSGDLTGASQYLDAAKWEKAKADERAAQRAALIYKEPTAEEYKAAMEQNAKSGFFTPKQDANNRELEMALGMKQGRTMNINDADKGNSNPGYTKKKSCEEGYEHNCQTCTMTYEARRRGFKVTAAPSPEDRTLADNFYNWANKNKLDWRDRFLNEDGTRPKPIRTMTAVDDTPAAKNKFIEQATLNIGRYEIYCAWKKGGAHVFMVERTKDGTLLWIDPQSGKVQKSNFYADNMKSDSIEVLRVDDKLINPKFASRLIKKTK